MATIKPASGGPGRSGAPRRFLPPKKSARSKSPRRPDIDRPEGSDDHGTAPLAALPQGNGAPAPSAAETGESETNARALIDAISAIVRAESVEEIARSALDAVRRRFGWAYASFWELDESREALVFKLESGEVDKGFARACRSARFREGQGLNGRAWKRRDAVAVGDLSEVTDSPLIRASSRSEGAIESGGISRHQATYRATVAFRLSASGVQKSPWLKRLSRCSTS